ncbi:nitroreductase family protein [Helicobacter pylori]
MKFLDQEKRRQLLNERHSCKMFDSHYEFSSEELEEIAEIARLSPSSYNTQPWRFVMVTTQRRKAPSFSYGDTRRNALGLIAYQCCRYIQK